MYPKITAQIKHAMSEFAYNPSEYGTLPAIRWSERDCQTVTLPASADNQTMCGSE
jgi:hypothetical protein